MGALQQVLLSGAAAVASSNTKRLFHFNGTNGSTTFTDSASSATVTVNGNAQLSTTSPKFGSASLLLDGSGDWVKSANDAGLDLGTGDYCVEGFLNFAGLGNQGIFHAFAGTPASQTGGISLAYNGSQYQMTTNTNNDFYTVTPSTGTWYHWAMFRVGTNTYLAIDGVIRITKASTGQSLTGLDLNIGMYYSTSFTFNGKLDEIRVTKGSAVYTAAGFTPPSAEFTYP